jgi:CTD nuclear envelope phosphatase 1
MVARHADGVSHTPTDADGDAQADEKTPLLSSNAPNDGPYAETLPPSKRRLLPQRITGAVFSGLQVLAWPVVAVGTYVVACFYHSDGRFSLVAPVYHIAHCFSRPRRTKPMAQRRASGSKEGDKERRKSRRLSTAQSKPRRPVQRVPSGASASTAMTSDSESERPPTRDEDLDTPSRHTRSKSNASSVAEEIAPAKRQIRIKLHNEDALRQRKAVKKTSRGGAQGDAQVSTEAANALKSPIGSIASKQLTKFPRAPQPPRPLVPRRQPSYSTAGVSAVGPHQKTLIIDLDETLIHSMAKYGRYTTGHMVEVKLQQPVSAGGQSIGPQVPILYYVHKRPHCDEFLKKVGASIRSLRPPRVHVADDCIRFVSGIIWSSSPRRCKSTRIP